MLIIIIHKINLYSTVRIGKEMLASSYSIDISTAQHTGEYSTWTLVHS
jgi:hypothetical protein